MHDLHFVLQESLLLAARHIALVDTQVVRASVSLSRRLM